MQMQQRQDHKMKMPSRVDLTLAELQEMAARQQQQIEQQQEVLVAKEQRLKFLKQQEQRHLQIAGENERLRRLRERVEVQEAKLKKLRALRGEATSQVNSNVTLASELEAIKTLFHEKEKELASAVRKVDQLTRQLDELRKQKPTNGSSSAPAHNGQASSELEKLRKELVMYNVLNEEQNSKLASHRELLQQRKEEMMHLDEKIAELQSRFKMKPLPLSLRKDDNKTGRQGRPLSNNVAAVEPYVKHPPKDSDDDLNKEKMQPLTKQDPKYQTLPHNLKFKDNGMKKAKDEVADAKQLNKSASVGKLGSSEPGFKTTAPSSSQMATSKQVPPSYSSVMGLAAKQGSQSSFISKDMPPPPSSTAGIPVTIAVMTPSTRVTSLMTNFVPRPYGSSYSSSVLGTRPVPSSVSDTSVLSTPNTSVSLPKTSTPVTSSQDQRPGFGASQPSTYVPPASLQNTYSTSSSRISTSAPPAKIATPGSSHMTHSSGSTMFGVSHSGSSYSVSGESSQNVMNQTTTTTSAPKTPIYASKSVIANTYMRKLGPTAMEKYRNSMSQIYQGFPSSQVGGSDGLKSDQTDRSMTATVAPMGKHSEQRSNQSNEMRNMVSLKQQQFEISEEKSEGDAAPYGRDPPPYNIDPVKFRPNAPRPHRRRSSSGDSPRTEDKVHAPRVPTPHSLLEDDVFGNKEEADGSKMLTKPSGVLQSEQGNQQSFKEPASPKEKQPRDHSERLPLALRRKGNLKSKDSTKSSRRVSFDPLALLLDASLEGELDLVKKTAQEVPDPSCPNDEGITALHNAICAGHFEIVKFLVEFGCNVNAPDSDGWTPLHCAASCNNLPMVKVLVEHGACIFATTISDHETAAEKCEEDEDGYDGCSEYLYNIQEKLGVLNNGVVYAVFDYRAQNSDELDFNTQDKLTVLRKGDETEQEWWWAKKDNREGYIPRNLLGLYPRVQPQWLKDK